MCGLTVSLTLSQKNVVVEERIRNWSPSRGEIWVNWKARGKWGTIEMQAATMKQVLPKDESCRRFAMTWALPSRVPMMTLWCERKRSVQLSVYPQCRPDTSTVYSITRFHSECSIYAVSVMTSPINWLGILRRIIRGLEYALYPTSLSEEAIDRPMKL